MTREVTVAVGAASVDAADLVLDLGPQHPSAHGLLRLALVLDGDTIVRADPLVGYMHRGAEKLFELRDYRQILALANRHDWLSAFSSELGVALAVERMLGMEVPARAVWLRTLLAEVNRVLSGLLFLGSFPPQLGIAGPHAAAWRCRERLLPLMEELTGGRVHFMFTRIGGLAHDVPAGWFGRLREAVAVVRGEVRSALDDAIRGDAAFVSATRGKGVLRHVDAVAYGVSGPPARAAGLDVDLRRDEPYLAYPELGFGTAFPVVGGRAGDSHERFRCLLDQVYVSLDLVDACLDGMPGGAVNVRLPKTLTAPEGHIYVATENPLGTMGYYLVSRGDKTPWRLAMRTASFNNVSVLPAVLPGTELRDLVAVLASLFFVLGDVDK